MNSARIIPVLLLKSNGLVKGIRFRDHKYVGDPINAVKIFNDKEVDELIFLDITASYENKQPNIDIVAKLADECYMPFAFGGGIKNVFEIGRVIESGAEKVSLNSSAFENPALIKEASSIFGSQSIIISIDYQRSFLGKKLVWTKSATNKTSVQVLEWAKKAEDMGAGEILLTSIDLDGSGQGYDLEMIEQISSAISIPLIACGGAGKAEDFTSALEKGASAVAAGSKFVFHGKHRAVLISYP